MKIEFDLKRYTSILKEIIDEMEGLDRPTEETIENYPVTSQLCWAVAFSDGLEKVIVKNFLAGLPFPGEAASIFMAVGYRMAQEDAKKNA